MTDPVTTIQATTAVVDASNSMLQSLITFSSTILYAVTAAAAFLPKPSKNAPEYARTIYKYVSYIAWNVKHATNAADDRRKEHRDEDVPNEVQQ